jgi:Zn-dependent peptidase ImmA (M78 family)
MTTLTSFGDPARFEIAVRWIEDPEPRERRPAHGGWSTGELRLTVGGLVLTQHQHCGESFDGVRWYLLPIFEWLAENWVSLLHEERFTWRENSSAPAATATFLALRRLIGADDSAGQALYTEVQNWWSRHALRAADPSALYPDVIFRRLSDDIEISWTARQPPHTPEGFRFALTPGAATLPISDVAEPLWEALAWVVSTTDVLKEEDRNSIARLDRRIAELANLSMPRLEASYLPSPLFEHLTQVRKQRSLLDDSVLMPSVPAIDCLDDAVLMFGGVSPDIGVQDIQTITDLLVSQSGGSESPDLVKLVDESIGAPLTAPFEEGYDLAEQLLEELALPGDAVAVDVHALLLTLNVKVVYEALGTSTIRGVALAGTRYAPAILVNRTSRYNETEPCRRFTLAHELCHILYDRSRAQRIAHTSGPWAAPGIEKRANAFAAMLLMPRELLRRSTRLDDLTQETVRAVAETLQVGASALIEHLYNTSMIDELKRDELRALVRTTP